MSNWIDEFDHLPFVHYTENYIFELSSDFNLIIDLFTESELLRICSHLGLIPYPRKPAFVTFATSDLLFTYSPDVGYHSEVDLDGYSSYSGYDSIPSDFFIDDRVPVRDPVDVLREQLSDTELEDEEDGDTFGAYYGPWPAGNRA